MDGTSKTPAKAHQYIPESMLVITQLKAAKIDHKY